MNGWDEVIRIGVISFKFTLLDKIKFFSILFFPIFNWYIKNLRKELS